jgi:hypothetical protein
MDWTIKDVSQANHNPEAIVNGMAGKAPLMLDAKVGTPITLDAAGSKDRDGNSLRYAWFFYAESGSGLPGAGGRRGGAGGIPSAPAGGRPTPTPRVTITNGGSPTATVLPNSPGTAHIILAVTDNGTPPLTSYRRVILTIQGDAR